MEDRVLLGRTVSVLVAIAVAACGREGPGSGGAGGSSGDPSGGCTITLSGALTGTAPCAAGGVYVASRNQLTFSIVNVATETSFSSLAFASRLPVTSLQTGTFTSTNSTQAQTAVSGSTSGQFWLQSFNFSGTADQGTFSLTITSTDEVDSFHGIARFNAHGSLTATLAPSGSASGTLNVSVTF